MMSQSESVMTRKGSEHGGVGGDEGRKRLDLRIEPDLRKLAEEMADHWGMPLSAYIRLALRERIDQDQANRPRLYRPGKRRKRKPKT